MGQRIIIVDEKDNEIGSAHRESMIPDDPRIHRTSALWITNPKNEILLAQRAFTKQYNPGKWGPAVTGTVEVGETYESNIIKEAYEELGLTIETADLTKGQKIRKSEMLNLFDQLFLLTIESDCREFILQKSEVEQVQWFSKSELEKKICDHPEIFASAVKWFLELRLV